LLPALATCKNADYAVDIEQLKWLSKSLT